MEVRVFGPVAVRHGADLVPITGNRPARLLRALALEPRLPVEADALVDAAWAAHPPANPAKALQTLIVRLRRAAGRDLVATVPGGYALGTGVTTDVERIEGQLACALADRDDDRRVRVLGEVLGEWSADPFGDLDDWRGARAQSARLAERRRTVEDTWLALRVRCDGPVPTLGDLEAAVAREPLREPRWLLLAQALRDADRVADALQALDRARRTFAVELGIPPGALLQEFEEELLVTSTPALIDDPVLRIERHRERAHVALAEGDAALAAKELTIAVEEARASDSPAASVVDLQLSLSAAHRRAGAAAAAREVLEEAAGLARLSGDTARLAEVALAGSGDAWQTTLDATASAIPLLQEALAALPPGPTRLRARLLARYAVAASHVEPQAELDRLLAEASDLAAIVDDATTTATVLIALNVVDQDPRRREPRRRRFEQLLELADREARPPWRAAVLPSLARLTAQEGDIETALALLDDVVAYGESTGDPVAAAAAGARAMLHASVTGGFPEVLAAIDVTARSFESAMTDPSGSAVVRWAQTGVATFVYDRLEIATDQVMPLPRTSMDVLMTAYVAAALGATGRKEAGLEVLRRIAPEQIDALPRDLYWLPLLWATGRAVWELGDRDRAEALYDCCVPVMDLLVVDGGCMFLGAVAHHAGLAASVAGRRNVACELLAGAAEQHARIGSAWWKRQSDAALGRAR